MKIKINGVEHEIEDSKLSEAQEKGELELTSDKLINSESEDYVVKKKDDFESYVNNLTKERYEAGKETQEKRRVNELAPKLGIELDEEKKTFDNLIEKYKGKLAEDYKKEPNKKIEELQQEKEQFQNKLQDWEQKYNELDNQFKTEKTQMRKNQLISKNLPDYELNIKKDDFKALFDNYYKVEFNENEEPIVKQRETGKVLKDDNTLNPLPVKDVIDSFAKGYAKKPEGGNGEGDRSGQGGSKTSYDKFVEEMEAQGVSQGSEKFNQQMSKRISEQTLEV